MLDSGGRRIHTQALTFSSECNMKHDSWSFLPRNQSDQAMDKLNGRKRRQASGAPSLRNRYRRHNVLGITPEPQVFNNVMPGHIPP